MIYVSSAGVLGMSASSGTIDESARYANETSNLYFRSKIQAEHRLFEWLESHRVPVVLILPGWMFGPFDEAPTTSGRLVQDFSGPEDPGDYSGRSQRG